MTVMSRLVALLENQLTNSLEDLTLLLASFSSDLNKTLIKGRQATQWQQVGW